MKNGGPQCRCIMKEKRNCWFCLARPTSQGCTKEIVGQFPCTFQENNSWEITEINAYEENVHPCTGCKIPVRKGKAVCSMILTRIDKELRASDLLVVASPLFITALSFSPLKAVLDRTQRYFEARFSLGIRPPIKKHRKLCCF